MKLSIWVTVSDLLNMRQSPIERAIEFFDKKAQMFHSQPSDYIFHLLKKSGVEGIELLVPLHTSENNLIDIKTIIKRNAISIFSVHQSLSNISVISDREIEKLCQIAKIFSASVVVLHAVTLGKKLLDDSFIRKLKTLQKTYGISFGIENMDKSPFPMEPFIYKGEEFSSLLNNAGLSITFDIAHLSQAGGEIILFYLKNKARIINIHISDYKKTWLNTYLISQFSTHLPLGGGDLPLETFLASLKKENYKGLVTMEINAGLTEFCKSAEMIKKYLNE